MTLKKGGDFKKEHTSKNVATASTPSEKGRFVAHHSAATGIASESARIPAKSVLLHVHLVATRGHVARDGHLTVEASMMSSTPHLMMIMRIVVVRHGPIELTHSTAAATHVIESISGIAPGFGVH